MIQTDLQRKNLEEFLHDLICGARNSQQVGILVEVLMAMQVPGPVGDTDATKPGCSADPQSPDDCPGDVAVSARASAAETLQSSLETKLRYCHRPWCPGGFGRGFRAVHPAGRWNRHPSPFVAVPALEVMDAD